MATMAAKAAAREIVRVAHRTRARGAAGSARRATHHAGTCVPWRLASPRRGERDLPAACRCASGDAPSAPAAEAPSAPAPAADDPAALLPKLDLRCGVILSAAAHPDADSLYVESVDVGEEEPRTIVSGLRDYVALEDMAGARCVVVANLKPRNMRGVKSFGMLLCASDKEGGKVELLAAPEGAPAGERLAFASAFTTDQPAPDGANKIQKKKTWEKVQAGLRTSPEGMATWQAAEGDGGPLPLLSSAGPVAAPSLTDCPIS